MFDEFVPVAFTLVVFEATKVFQGAGWGSAFGLNPAVAHVAFAEAIATWFA